jgi:hypothetical protein
MEKLSQEIKEKIISLMSERVIGGLDIDSLVTYATERYEEALRQLNDEELREQMLDVLEYDIDELI